jgi:hypothetical protein
LSLEIKGYLKELQATLGKQDMMKLGTIGITDAANGINNALKTGQIPSVTVSTDLVSAVSSVGIGTCLAFLATIIVKKNRKSPFVRFMAKLFGADVLSMDKDFVINKLKSDKDYYRRIQVKVVNLIVGGRINELLTMFSQEFGMPEQDAMEVYLQIKDVILDGWTTGFIMKIYESNVRLESLILRESAEVKQYFSSLTKDQGNQIENLKSGLLNQLKELEANIQQNYSKVINENNLSQSGLRLVTFNTNFGEGLNNCWRTGSFTEAEVSSGYDAVRTKFLKEINGSIENHKGTILYGKPYYGKSTLLLRIMVEAALKGNIVIFCEKATIGSSNLIQKALETLSKEAPSRVLVIVDDVDSKDNEAMFNVYQRLARRTDLQNLKFVFATDHKRLKGAKYSTSDLRPIEFTEANMHSIDLDFTQDDAQIFLEQSIKVCSPFDTVPQGEIIEIAKGLHKLSGGDPLMFTFILMEYLERGEESVQEEAKSSINFLNRNLNEITKEIDNNRILWQPAILCSLLGIIDSQISEYFTTKCNVGANHLNDLSYISFLFKEKQYKVRHPSWALEFLSYVYDTKFNNHFESIDMEYHIADILNCFFRNISMESSFDLLLLCSSIENKRFEPIMKIILKNFVPPDRAAEEYKQELNFLRKELDDLYFSSGLKKIAKRISIFFRILWNKFRLRFKTTSSRS